MPHSITPCLRADVVVRPFDAVEGDRRFVVAVDDRHFIVTAAVAAVLEESREPGTFASIAQRASQRLGVSLSQEQVGRLLREQVPAILFQASAEHGKARAPVWFRRRVVSGAALGPALKWAARLFAAHVALVLTVMFVVVDALVAARAFSTRGEVLATVDAVVAIALTLTGVAVHELGHLAACVRYGAPHGGVGLGLYWCFPTFYAEVHGAWLLARQQRAVVDIGGIYFQCAYVLALGVLYLASGAAAVLSAIAWSHLLMLHTLNPVLKFDGYWLLADLTGSYNLHQKVRSIAQQTWRALRLMRRLCLPSRGELALLVAFVAVALVYFSYVLAMLGHSLAAAASGAVNSLSALQAIANAALLALWLAMAAGVSLLLARSLTVLAREQPNDR